MGKSKEIIQSKYKKMKLLTSILVAGSTSAQTVAPSEPTTAQIKSHGCQDGTPNALYDGFTFNKCISDTECDSKVGYNIFNHFHESGNDDLTLVPECRLISANPMPGFTCGSNPTLKTGTKIVVREISSTGYNDNRAIKILRSGRYTSLESDLTSQSNCPDHENTTYCPNIQHFYDGCPSTETVDGLVVFRDPFNQVDCKPMVTDHKENDEWIEEHKIYIGYDDLVTTVPGNLEVRTDIHKIYEVSCKISKMGEVGTDIELELVTDNEDIEDSIDTNFYIEKYFGDITDKSTRIQLDETDVIPFSPNADPNDRFQFKVWSDHDKEYVHLETCKLTLDGDSTFEQEFINDGCITDNWEIFFSNDNRVEKINEDWFNMRPLLIGCKSKWHIDCTVASCKRGLETSNLGAYEEFCKADQKCEHRYTGSFMDVNARKRRSPDNSDGTPAEDHVELDLVHPCYYVDQQTTEYCIDENTCWTLEQCPAVFPDDFGNYDFDQIMKEFEEAVKEHIEVAISSTQSPIDARDQIMKSIQDNASRVIEAKQSFDDAIEAIIESINSL